MAFLLSFAGIFGGFLGGYLIKKRHVHDQKVMILGLIFSVIGCSLLVIDALILQDKEVGQNIAVIMIFAPMMLHMVGHNLLIPMTLRYALEDYAKVTGTAGCVSRETGMFSRR